MIPNVVLPIIIIVVLVVVNGVFVAAEFALVGARRSRLQGFADQGNSVAQWLVDVFDRPTGKDGYIAIAQLGITLASIGLGMYGEPAVAGWLYGPFESFGLSYHAAHTVGFIVALSGITYMHVVFGEMIPKALALQAPEQVSLRVNPVMRVFGLVFRPMVWVLNTVSLSLMRLLRIPEPDKRLSLYTSSELEIVTDESADSGQLATLQRNLIHNIFDLEKRRAEELMTPRSQMETFDISASPEEILGRIADSSRTRFPVIDSNLDTVLGVLHVKDFIHAHATKKDLSLRKLIRHLPTVAETTTAAQLLSRFTREHTHAILVVDEFGGTVGMVTFDDLIGEVLEEAGTDSVEVMRHDDESFSVPGRFTLSELLEDHGISVSHIHVTTVAGLVLAECGVVPPVGTVVVSDGHSFEVEEVEGRAITQIRVRTLTSSVEGEDNVPET